MEKTINKKTIILFGESGCGKSTVEKILQTKGYIKAKSLTTRKPRPGEIDGVDYHFTNKENINDLVELGEIVEITEYLGEIYALTKDECGPNMIMVVELEGLRQLKENKDLSLYSVYLKASQSTRKTRMLARGDNLTKVNERLQNDEEVFKDSESKADYILDVDILTPEEIANDIVKSMLK